MKKISIAILTLLVALTACKKVPEVNLKYVDVERDLITVGTTTATVQCDYQYIATLKKAYFYYGEGQNEVDMNTAEMRVVQNTLYVDLTGLKENTTYSYYYEFHNGFNFMRTALKTFKTEVGNGGGEEPPTPPEIMLPTVITAMVTEITTNSAQCGGEVVNDGGAEVTERGICWGTNENPTLNDSHFAAGMGIGTFTAMMNGLEANTTYHVRAYATNEKGTAYGLDKEFTTLSGGGSGIPEGAINGLFTINENGDKVYFSQGNLQYQASTNTWRFAEHQWDYVGGTGYSGYHVGNVNGSSNDNISQTYEGWIDLFGFGTSGYNHGAICYQPWSINQTWSNYFAYGDAIMNLYDGNGKADWGYNPIYNGGNQEKYGWRTLTCEEWNYVFEQRITSSGIHYAKATVNDIYGIILLPDNWNANIYLYEADTYDADYNYNIFDNLQWSNMEASGAVFLPITGYRKGTSLLDETRGYYWSSIIFMGETDGTSAYAICFSDWDCGCYCVSYRYYGTSVRLVQDAK